jgi:hypothetical protein
VARSVLACGLVLVVCGLVAPGAQATVREWQMARVGLDPTLTEANPSARLIGMGSPLLTVPDEGSELNTYDFAGNIAGLLEDSDRWVIDAWTGNFQQDYERSGLQSDRRFGNAGFQVVQRSRDRALGANVNWAFLTVADRAGDWRKIRGPRISPLINQRFGPVTVGAMVGVEQEKEDLITTNFFGLRHRQERWVGQFGAMADLWGLQWGANWHFENGDVLGRAVDPERFHEDTYTWTRPVNRYGASVILPRRGSIEGGVRLGWLDRQGSERVKVSWSDDSPQNPSHTDFYTESVTFHEQESSRGVATRWRLHLGPGSIVGVDAAYRSEELDVQEGINYKGSMREGRSADDSFDAGVGASQRIFGGRLLAALEARAAFQDWETRQVAGVLEKGTARTFGATGALEYFVSSRVMVRAGLHLESQDLNIDAPLTLSVQDAVSGGISYAPLGGLVQVHGALRFERSRPSDETATQVPETTVVSYTVVARLLP